jgi:Trypsin-like peptidase domain
MKTFTLALVAVLFGTAAQRDARVDRMNNGTAKVNAAKEAGVISGAGIMLGQLDGKTFFLTACHVVAESRSIGITLFARPDEDPAPASLFDNRCDDTHDLAVLVVDTDQLKGSVDQIRQADLSRVRRGDRVLVMGHSPNGEWSYRDAKVQSIDGSHILFDKGVAQGGDSGGPLLNASGDLIGIDVGEVAQRKFERAIRIDKALEIIDGWRVPYKTLVRVDFCATIQSIITQSEKDFDDIRGVKRKKIEYAPDQQWELNDQKIDITGERGSYLLRGNSRYGFGDKTTVYVANFKRQRSQEQAWRLANELARRVQACLPSKERIWTSGDNCRYSSWRRRWSQTPMMFVTYVKPLYSEVELIMYRGYGAPNVCR